MLRTRIGDLARAAGIEKAYHFQQQTGFHPSMASRLYNDDVRGLELPTIERLCVFFGCQPGELFVLEAAGKVKQATKRAGAQSKGRGESKQKKAAAAKN